MACLGPHSEVERKERGMSERELVSRPGVLLLLESSVGCLGFRRFTLQW